MVTALRASIHDAFPEPIKQPSLCTLRVLEGTELGNSPDERLERSCQQELALYRLSLHYADYRFAQNLQESPNGFQHVDKVQQFVLRTIEQTKNKGHIVFFGFGISEPLQRAAELFEKVTIIVGDKTLADNRMKKLPPELRGKCHIIGEDLTGGFQINLTKIVAKYALSEWASHEKRVGFLKDVTEFFEGYKPQATVLKEPIGADCLISSLVLSQLNRTDSYLVPRFHNIFCRVWNGIYFPSDEPVYARLHAALTLLTFRIKAFHLSELRKHAANSSARIGFLDTVAVSRPEKLLCLTIGWKHQAIHEKPTLDSFAENFVVTAKKVPQPLPLPILENSMWDARWVWSWLNGEKWHVAGTILTPMA